MMMTHQRCLARLVCTMVLLGITCSYGFSFRSRLPTVSTFANIAAISSNNAVGSKLSTSLQAAATLSVGDFSELATPVQYGPHLKIKGKVLNAWGILYALATFSVAVIVLPFMIVSSVLADLLGNGKVRQSTCSSSSAKR
jgi:hypothetical protein